MKAFGVLCAFALFLLMVAAPAAYSQDQNRDDSKPKAEEAPKPQDEKAAKPDKAQQDDRAKQDEKAQQDQKAQEKEQEKQQKNQDKENKKAQQEQDRNMRDEQRDQQHPVDNRQMDNRPADNRQEMGRDQNRPAADRGRHIPDDQFRAHFGRQHTFHVQRTEVVNVSQPVVVYGGYSFQLVDAWPSDWGFDDDCYVDYIDGEYFLFDVMHPGVRIAVFVVG